MAGNENIAEPQPVYTGTILYPSPSPYALAITPLVQLKKIFQSLYTSLLKMMWQELWAGEVQNKPG